MRGDSVPGPDPGRLAAPRTTSDPGSCNKAWARQKAAFRDAAPADNAVSVPKRRNLNEGRVREWRSLSPELRTCL